jgi:hypothetical protein
MVNTKAGKPKGWFMVSAVWVGSTRPPAVTTGSLVALAPGSSRLPNISAISPRTQLKEESTTMAEG